MAKKRAKISLAQPVQPRTGDLEGLFSSGGDVEQPSGLQLLAIRIEAVRPDPDQPRRSFPEDSLTELSDSIRQDGIIQPIEVTEIAPNQYMIVHGERRWRAAKMVGLETVPAVVRRSDYDGATRLVRQLVENIQREDLNDVDRAAGLLRLKEVMQMEMNASITDPARGEGNGGKSMPWSKTVTWAKVGKRLGYTRQRIHQLIRLLDLPNDIKDDVRHGRLSERETRVYHGLRKNQQTALHRARYRENLSQAEVRSVARQLKEDPSESVSQAIIIIRSPQPQEEAVYETDTAGADGPVEASPAAPSTGKPRPTAALRSQPWTEGGVLPPRQTRPTSIDRLDYVRGHLARIQRQGLAQQERQEMVRLLNLIQQDVVSLLFTLQGDEEPEA
ncbi:MAG: ParB/RepB/Spo0J family partition protein [Candidatus Promineifilaceae bacterium]|jgi:ParB family chromosome partitioning protein